MRDCVSKNLREHGRRASLRRFSFVIVKNFKICVKRIDNNWQCSEYARKQIFAHCKTYLRVAMWWVYMSTRPSRTRPSQAIGQRQTASIILMKRPCSAWDSDSAEPYPIFWAPHALETSQIFPTQQTWRTVRHLREPGIIWKSLKFTATGRLRGTQRTDGRTDGRTFTPHNHKYNSLHASHSRVKSETVIPCANMWETFLEMWFVQFHRGSGHFPLVPQCDVVSVIGSQC